MPKTDGLFQLFNEIGIIAQLSQTTFERVMPTGMTLAQFTVLNHFVRLGGERSPAELARAFQVTKATMTSTLHRLENKGLITVEPDPQDGRAKKVAITKEGIGMRCECIAALEPELARLAQRVASLPVCPLVAQLSRLRAILDDDRV